MPCARYLPALVLALLVVNSSRADGGKKGGYPFAVPPAKALELLAGLGEVAPTPDEEGLLAEARCGKLAKWPFDEIALLASGVTDSAKRKDYLARLDGWEAKAREATAKVKTPREKGEKLLHFLHDGPMAKG